MRVKLDTRTSDTWVNYAKNSLCDPDIASCHNSVYDPALSSTAKDLNQPFTAYYNGSTGSTVNIQTGATGDFFSDTFTFGGTPVPNAQFGVGNDSTQTEGVLGLGFSATQQNAQYPTVPELLMQNGLTKSLAYSVWLNNITAPQGDIIFGGVDTTKYTGPLITRPMVPGANGKIENPSIWLDGMFFNFGHMPEFGSRLDLDEFPFAVTLDSGSTDAFLPKGLVDSIYKDVDAYIYNGTTAIVSCHYMFNLSYSLQFVFGSSNIYVPLINFVGLPGRATGNSSECQLGINAQKNPGDPLVLGEVFLRAAYVVYDLGNQEISIAQSNYNGPPTPNVLEILPGPSGVPGAILGEGSAGSSASNASSQAAKREWRPRGSRRAAL